MNQSTPPGDSDARELRRLTPEECRQMADSLSDLPPEYRLSAEDLEMVQEEVFGPAAYGDYGSAAAAAQAMQRRLESLLAAKAKSLDALDNAMAADRRSLRDLLLDDLKDLNRLIAETKARLEHSRFQQRHEN